MKCNECRELLPALVFGEDLHDKRPEIEDHLAQCAACREELERMKSVYDELVDDAQSDDLTEVERLRLEKAVYSDLAAGVSLRKPARRSFAILTRLAAALVLFALGYLAHSLLPGPSSQPAIIHKAQGSQTLATYDRDQYEGLRFSAAGLKAIAQGRKAIAERLDKGIPESAEDH